MKTSASRSGLAAAFNHSANPYVTGPWETPSVSSPVALTDGFAKQSVPTPPIAAVDESRPTRSLHDVMGMPLISRRVGG